MYDKMTLFGAEQFPVKAATAEINCCTSAERISSHIVIQTAVVCVFTPLHVRLSPLNETVQQVENLHSSERCQLEVQFVRLRTGFVQNV